MKKTQADYLKAALLGADWFCNTQMGDDSQPTFSANRGRFLYNAHTKSDHGTWGIDWTSARALMVLMAASENSKSKKKYKEAIRLGLQYIYSLQVFDSRNKVAYGAFHEETPQSNWVYPRDGIEVADALLGHYLLSGDEESLFRAEFYLDWYLREAMVLHKKGFWWIHRDIQFSGKKSLALGNYQGGGIMALSHAWKITGKAKYKTAIKRLADAMIALYFKKPGPMRDSVKGNDHHLTDSGIIENDDGSGIALLCAHQVLGQKKYLDVAISLASYHLERRGDFSIYCATPASAVFLMEMARHTGGGEYYQAALGCLEKVLKMQFKKASRVNCHGAFIGEDEGGINYVKGFTPKVDEMVSTRSTAYSCLALFKMGAKKWPYGYSVLEMD